MTRAIRIEAHGGADSLEWVSVVVGKPGPGEVRLRQHAIGINFIDVYQRTGLYKLPSLPAILGLEGAGDVLEVGDGVVDLAVGDRVAYAGCPGAYAQERLAPADRMVKLPAAISYETAAAIMLKGMTARYLLRETYPVGRGTVMLWHAAAGGVGLIACQWANALGATIIGLASSPEKMALAKANGCTHVLNSRTDKIVDRVRELTNGRGCDVAYDSVGRDTVQISLDCLKPKGLWVSFGNASGPVPPFDLTLLKGSLFATRPTLFAYIATRQDLLANAADLFSMVASEKIRISINHQYPLSEAGLAHLDLEARKTTGSIILVP